MPDHFMLLSGLGLSIVAAYLAFLMNWIRMSAIYTVIVIGTIVLGFGGWLLATALVLFFVSSSIFTHFSGGKIEDPNDTKTSLNEQKRRDSYQVWSNGFWVSVFAMMAFLLQSDLLLIAAFASVATATSDTWATEIGSRNPGITKKITNFEPVEPGTDGGVSLKGTLAAAAGSFTIGLLLLFSGNPDSVMFFWVVFLSGFLGCVADSYFGVFIQTNENVKLLVGPDSAFDELTLKNNIVNWLATGLSGLIAIVFTQLF